MCWCPQTSSVKFWVQDGTGSVTIMQWVDIDESQEQVDARAELVPGTYVRVVGNIRLDHNTKVKHVGAFNMRKITDMNEITYHFLDSIHSHLYNTQGPKSAPPAGISNFASPGKPSMGPAGGAAAGQYGASSTAAYSAPAGGAGGVGGAGASNVADLVNRAFNELTV